VVTDIGCQSDVAAANPKIVDRLGRLAAEARAEFGDRGKVGHGRRPIGAIENPQPQVLVKE